MTLGKHPFIALFSAVLAFTGATTAQAADAQPEASERPPAYFNFMVTGSMVHEDPGNRLTLRDRRGFATPGIALRAGGVVGQRHLVGLFFQGNWRSTRTVVDSVGDDRKWGAISSWYVGPEYRFITDFGLYAGASLGFAYTFADNHVGGGGSPDCNRFSCLAEHMRRTDDQGIPGVGVRAVLGYEYRFRRNLALNVEAFGGVLHGEDEDDAAMTLPTYGLALGVGF
jgi:hypothetical protein